MSKKMSVLVLSLCSISPQLVAQSSPSELPKNYANEPANIQAIDKQIAELEKQKEVLQASQYEANEAAMNQEFQGSWMNYQEDIKKNGSFESRIQKIQEQIDALKAQRAKLAK